MDLKTKLIIGVQKRLNTYLTSQAADIRKDAWERRLQEAHATFPEDKQPLIQPLLQNQIDFLENVRQARGDDCDTNITIPNFTPFNFDGFLFSLAVEYLTDLNIHKIVGFQPIQAPVGSIYGMRYREKNADLAGHHKTITLEVVRSAVEALSRKYKASWTFEAMQDIKAMHGVDVEQEIMRMVGREMAEETTREVLNDLIDCAEAAHSTGEVHTLPSLNDEYSVYIREDIKRLMIKFNQMANDIARTSRRGPGSFIVAPPTLIALLQAYSPLKVVPPQEGPKSMSLPDMGTIVTQGTDGKDLPMYDLYCSSYTSELVEGDNDAMVLMGYIGRNRATDTGYVFSPYIPVMSTGVVLNPTTFQPHVSLMTRYGKKLYKSDEDHPFDGSSYYKKLRVNNIEFA